MALKVGRRRFIESAAIVIGAYASSQIFRQSSVADELSPRAYFPKVFGGSGHEPQESGVWLGGQALPYIFTGAGIGYSSKQASLSTVDIAAPEPDRAWIVLYTNEAIPIAKQQAEIVFRVSANGQTVFELTGQGNVISVKPFEQYRQIVFAVNEDLVYTQGDET
jgi:hypothetical protein